jgi:hypothetical protein
MTLEEAARARVDEILGEAPWVESATERSNKISEYIDEMSCIDLLALISTVLERHGIFPQGGF